jgi:uncharacterized protein YigA (DUF484 family)
MKDIDDIKRKNEEIEQQFLAIESDLASFSDVRKLFEALVVKLEEQFSIPFVWISMINRQNLPAAVHDLPSSKVLKYRLNIIKEGVFLNLIAHDTKPLLVNTDLRVFYRLLPLKNKFLIRSLAIAPITLRDEIIGSINLGDPSSIRYQPDMDTALLQRLASKVSIRLSEIIPDEKTGDAEIGEAINNTNL